jgi:bifunctional DNA-binding transcriptional regulator/antitoxin component of YhaV-PrlF toxin-antitoxin module
MPRISNRHQVTLPAEMLRLTDLHAGDEISFEPDLRTLDVELASGL